jgi:hypothetical protein
MIQCLHEHGNLVLDYGQGLDSVHLFFIFLYISHRRLFVLLGFAIALAFATAAFAAFTFIFAFAAFTAFAALAFAVFRFLGWFVVVIRVISSSLL